MSTVRGRLIAMEDGIARVHHEGGVAAIGVRAGTAAIGDLVVIEDGRLTVAVPARGTRDAGAAQRRTLDPRRVRAMEMRGRVESGIRDFFLARGFREVRTPALVPCPGMEPHIKPFQVVGGGWLQTSPEFAMKRLLAAGLERIFQMAPVFRDEPDAPHHRREFLMLEWYRAWAGMEEILVDTEELVATLARGIFGETRVGGIDVTPPWPRLRVRDLFSEHVGVDLGRDDLREACRRLGVAMAEDDGWDDLMQRLWLEKVEPRLPAGRAVFVVRYPASQAALAVIDEDADGTRWARRFEVYAGGLELANAFEELTDPVEQRRRFAADMALRARVHGPAIPVVPMPEEFLAALEDGMPPSGGIALGVDRLALLFAGEDDIGWMSWG